MSRRFGNGIDLQGQKGVGFADATSPNDAVNLAQVQAFVRGLSWKTASRAGSTTNVVLTAPGASIDGVALVALDRVLLKNQTAGAENGIYVWTGAAATLTRATDASNAAQLSGAAVSVTEGTVNADRTFTQNADGIVVGTTTLNWVQLGGAAAAYLAGVGLLLTGQTFSVIAGAGIIADATSVRIDPSVVTRKTAFNNTSGTSGAYTHNLGTRDVQVTIMDTVTFEEVITDVVHTDANTVTVSFGASAAAGAFRIIIQS